MEPNLKTYNVFVFGLDRAGKSTLINIIKGGNYLTLIKPTIAFNVEKFIYENVQFQIWDAPGQKNLRKTWAKGYERANILMFVLDSSDKERFKEAKTEFFNVLNSPMTKGLPILFCIHKSDLNHAIEQLNEIKSQFIEPVMKERRIIWVLSSIHDLNSLFNLLNSLLNIVLLRAKQAETILNIMDGLRHDINNQITIIKNCTTFLIEQNLNKESLDYVKSIDVAIDQTNNFLKKTKYELDDNKKNLEQISTQKLLQDSIAFISRGTNCQFEAKLDQDIPSIAFDADKFTQIINNLILNAIDAVGDKKKEGKITIIQKQIHISKQEIQKFPRNLKSNLPIKDGDYIQISIQDNGIGIPLSEQENIFKMYYTTKSDGHGLGLATVYSLVTVNNGYIDFESKINKGTTFNIYLPLKQE